MSGDTLATMTRLTSVDYSAERRIANSALSREDTWTRTLLSKVPEVTLLFWIVKVLSTTVGETAADFLSRRVELGLAATTAVLGLLCVAVLIWQLSTGRYRPGPYWLAVLLVDSLVAAGLGDGVAAHPWTITLMSATALLAVFVGWYLSEYTLSVHTVVTRRREVWYWCAILGAFALGASTGELVSQWLAGGPRGAAVFFGAVLVSITVGVYGFKMNSVLAFWAAYVLSGPFGSSLGHVLTSTHQEGGFGLSRTVTSLGFLIVILTTIAWLTAQVRRPEVGT